MKIVQINPVCGFGSTGKIATDIHNLLLEEGHESKVAYGRPGTFRIKDFFTPFSKSKPNYISEKDIYKIGNNTSVYTHLILSIITDKSGYYSVKATKQLINWLENYKPDIIQMHIVQGFYINIELLFKYIKRTNIKIFWTLHSCWSFTGHCSHFDFIQCNKWKTQCHSCPQKRAYPPSIVDNSKNNYLHKKELFTGIKDLTIITPSYWLENQVKQSFLQEYPIKTIHNGIDLSQFKPSYSNKISEKKIALGVASVWDDRKGLADFVKLATMLDDDYQIILVGLTEKQVKLMPKNIIAITRTNNIGELSELYTMADVFVNPTYEETLGLVNIEALACGTPVITYNTGGSPECIDNTCGIVIDKGDIEALKEKIEYVCKNTPFLSENCIIRSKNFDKNTKYMEYIDLYMGKN